MTDHLREAAGRIGHAIGWHDLATGRLVFEDGATPLATRMNVADVATAALGAVGAALADVAMRRGMDRPRVRVDRRAAALAMTAAEYLHVDGTPVRGWPELTQFYRASDGWVYLHGGFPPHTRRLLAALEAPGDRDGLAARVARMTAAEVEARCVASNTCGRRLRTPEEWAGHPHSLTIASQPFLKIEPLGEGATRRWGPAEKPLVGVRVLDLSRVLAGPTIGRTLAEHGADVIRIASPNLPSIEALVIDTGFGKRSAFVDLDTVEGRNTLTRLAREADVFIDGYRPESLAARGFGPKELAALNPGITHVNLSAWGEKGPWGGLRGYDSLVQAAVGLAAGDPPARLPCQPLDYLAGYLGAFAAIRGLVGRAETGQGARVSLTLAGMAHWLTRMAAEFGDETDPPPANPTATGISRELCTIVSDFGEITALRPALDVPWRPRVWQPPVPLGNDPPVWL